MLRTATLAEEGESFRAVRLRMITPVAKALLAVPLQHQHRIYGVLADALKDPAFQDALAGDGSEIVINSPKDFAAQLATETTKGEALIKRVGIKLD